MVNFLENALDACHMDRTKKEHTITLATKRLDGRIVFEIIDNGLGMDQETKNNLFTLFFLLQGVPGHGNRPVCFQSCHHPASRAYFG